MKPRFFTDRDLGRFRALPLDDSQSLGAAIESRAGRCEWVAAHDEYIFATNIECMSGGPTRLVWELNHAAPRPWLERRVLYVTPVTRSAAELVPELLPSGVRLEQIPLTKFSSGVIYDLAR